MGPGKADLLEAIRQAGSISAAARAMGMSYRRAWLLVDVMNRCFAKPLVETMPGGGAASGARVTPEGEAALAAYRTLSAQVDGASCGEAFDRLQNAVLDRPKPASG